MSWYEIQGLFFGLLVLPMHKIAVKNRFSKPCLHLAFIDTKLGFQKSPSSCHVTRQSWHDYFINPTWQQAKPSIVARFTNYRATNFPVIDPLSHVRISCHEPIPTWHDFFIILLQLPSVLLSIFDLI